MTHEMGFACEVADRVFFMGDGYIVTVTEQEADLQRSCSSTTTLHFFR